MGTAPILKPNPPKPTGQVVGYITWNGSLWTAQPNPLDPATVDKQFTIAAFITIPPPTPPPGEQYFPGTEQIATGHIISVTKRTTLLKEAGPQTTYTARYQMFELPLDKKFFIVVNPGAAFGTDAAAIPSDSNYLTITSSQVPAESDWTIQVVSRHIS
jgi:hypothetical protein